MANEAYVAEKVAEVAKSPKAMLLGAIGAMSSTPTNSANVAEELGLGKEEIQGARWIALFRKGKIDFEFLKGLLEIFEKPEKEKEMKTVKGGEHHLVVLKKKLAAIFEGGVVRESRRSDDYLDSLEVVDDNGKTICKIDGDGLVLCGLKEWVSRPTNIHVYQKIHYQKVVEFAKFLEKETSSKVVIYRQY